MKKILTTFVIVLVILGNLKAQDKLLFKLDEVIEGFNKAGTNTPYSPKTQGSTTSSLPSRIEVTDVPDGFLIRTDFNLKKFTFTGDLQWEVNLKQEFKLFHMPYMVTVGDSEITYVFEMQTNPFKAKKIKISTIDNSGKLSEKVLESDLNAFRTGKLAEGIKNTLNIYTSGGKLKVLAKSSDNKEKKILYRLYTYSNEKSTLNYTKLELPVSDYENNEADKIAAQNKSLMWNYLTNFNGKEIFYKRYFKDIKKSKKKEAVINIIELSNNKLGEVKSLDFNPNIMGDEIKFSEPSFLINQWDNSINLIGSMEINNRKLNGLYLMKYNFESFTSEYSREYYFIKILKPEIKTDLKPHYTIPEQVHRVYPLDFREEDVVFSPTNHLSLRIVTNYNLRSITFFELGFNPGGEHIKTDLIQYSANLSLLNKVIPTPKVYEKVWADGSSDNNSVWEYINLQAKDDKSFNTFWHPVKYSPQPRLVKIDQEKGTFHLVNVK